MSRSNDKLQQLVEEYGYDDEIGMAEDFIHDSCVPGICMNPGCNASYEMEPDQSQGWCEECQTNSVKSLFILMGVI